MRSGGFTPTYRRDIRGADTRCAGKPASRQVGGANPPSVSQTDGLTDDRVSARKVCTNVLPLNAVEGRNAKKEGLHFRQDRKQAADLKEGFGTQMDISEYIAS